MTTKMQQETPSQAVVITKENVAQTKRPDSHRNQWVQTEPREKTEEQQKVSAARDVPRTISDALFDVFILFLITDLRHSNNFL